MVEHFVLFTLKEDVTDAQYAELERAIYGLSGLGLLSGLSGAVGGCRAVALLAILVSEP